VGKQGPIAEKHDVRGDSRRLSASFVMLLKNSAKRKILDTMIMRYLQVTPMVLAIPSKS
jgi:hypothetical protein